MRNGHLTSRPRGDAAPAHTIIYAVHGNSLASGGRRQLDIGPYRLIDKVAARALGGSLDRQLARGREPEDGRLLAARAQDIVALRVRERLARDWERLLYRAARPAPALRNAVPLRRGPILAAEPAITELASLLRAPLPVSARGVAMARLLLTDAGGPLYWSAAPESLPVALRAAITRLDPALPLMDSARHPVA
jgi:hypothetical protein